MLTKNFFIDLHGCAKNQVDAEILNGILCKSGWQRVDRAELATLIIINSCGFIEAAKKESIDAVFELRQKCPNAKIILAGCLAERYADVFACEMEELDGVFGNGDLSLITGFVNEVCGLSSDASGGCVDSLEASCVVFKRREARASHKPLLKQPQVGISSGKRPHLFNFAGSVYIKITEGCNNHCSFCAIPIIRGSLRSREIGEILHEMREFIDRGVYEFNLVGQDLGVFGKEGGGEMPDEKLSPLALLLSHISRLEGRFVVRLLYIHPDHFPLDILDIMLKDARFLPYFDIPFQSGSEAIIQKMNRCGSPQKYLELIEKIRTAFSSSPYGTAAIRTTFLVGFPGENDENFEETLSFLKAAHCLWSGVFEYSKEEDTPAFRMRNQVAKRVKSRRRQMLEREQSLITESMLQGFVGKVFLVLVEELIDGGEGEKLLIGRTWFQAPDVDGVAVCSYEKGMRSIDGKAIGEGELVHVNILKVQGVDLIGKVLNSL